MPMTGSSSFIATGNIQPMRFVKLSTTLDGKVTICGAGEKCFGISQRGTRRSEYVDTNGYAASAGEPLEVFTEGEECLLEAGGTIAPGDYLKSGALGVGVATTTNLDFYGAVALQVGASGDLIKVKVQTGQVSS